MTIIHLACLVSCRQVRWRTIVWGLALQMVFALLIVRSRGGSIAVAWLGVRVAHFLGNVNGASKFVFSEPLSDHPIAFKVVCCFILILIRVVD